MIETIIAAMLALVIGFMIYSLINLHIENRVMEVEMRINGRLLEWQSGMTRLGKQLNETEKRIRMLEMLHDKELSEIMIRDRIDKPPKNYSEYIGDD